MIGFRLFSRGHPQKKIGLYKSCNDEHVTATTSLFQKAFAGTSSLGATTVLLAGIEDTGLACYCEDAQSSGGPVAERTASAWQ